jgi:Sulfotransferase family
VIVLIDGEGGSGKMVLRSLLDGHPQLAVAPIHDKIVDTLADYPPADDWLGHRDTTYLRQLLARSSYYDLEKYAARGGMDFEIAASRGRVRIPLRLDFPRCDATWMRRVRELAAWDLGGVVREVFAAIRESCLDAPPAERLAGCVGVGFDRARTRATYLEQYPDGKLIYLSRPVEDIMASRLHRQPIQGETTSAGLRDVDLRSFLESGKIGRIQARLRAVRALAARAPDRVLVVEFDELVCDTERVMRGVAAFLQIPFAGCLTRPTVVGHELVTPAGESYVGGRLDQASRMLTDEQRHLVAVEAGARPFVSLLAARPLAAARYAGMRARRAARAGRRRLGDLVAG